MTRPASSQSDGARSGDALVVADSDERLPDLSSAMRALATHLETAITGMFQLRATRPPRRPVLCP
jgi:hypothetical protein